MTTTPEQTNEVVVIFTGRTNRYSNGDPISQICSARFTGFADHEIRSNKDSYSLIIGDEMVSRSECTGAPTHHRGHLTFAIETAKNIAKLLEARKINNYQLINGEMLMGVDDYGAFSFHQYASKVPQEEFDAFQKTLENHLDEKEEKK